MKGSCLCGAVVWEVRGPVAHVTLCHCGQCRKQSGSAFWASANVAAADLVFLCGADNVGRYGSSPGVLRSFCKTCGSALEWRSEAEPGRTAIAMGGADGAAPSPDRHIFVADKAPWYDIDAVLPRRAH